MKKITLTLALLLPCIAANAAPITQLTITGGSHSLIDDPMPESFSAGAFADMTVGGYDGSAPTSMDFASTSIVTFLFPILGNGVVYTSPTTDAGTSFAAPAGDITDGVATLELDSWTAWSAGNVMNLGSTSTKGATETCATSANLITRCSTAIIVDSYDPITGEFTASWDAVHTESSPFAGQLSSWTISGTMSAVPVPAAIWLFGSGIMLMAGLVRRRKAA